VNPIELAIQLAGLIRQSPGIVSANATGGYVNVKFDDASLVELLGSCGLPVCHFYEVQPVAVVDYFGANVGKPLHIGHLCAPSIGQAIINAFRHKGYRVIGDMHQGDWGSLFGKLAIGYRRFGSAEALEADATEHLFEVYVKLTAAEASDPSIAEEYREAFQKLSRGDPEMVALWLSFTQKTIHTALELGKRLLVFPDVMIGEAFYEGIGLPTLGNYPELRTSMSEVVAELIQLGIATENEDGSVGVIFDESTKIPSCMLAKRDGTHGYLASDLACVKYRITNGWNPEHIVYCMDVRQELHVRQIFEVARLWIERSEWGKSIAIVPQCFLAKNGFLKLKDGAMSTRKGNIIRLGALMDEGISRVDALLKEK
jgi:arginyl-tRNA synthetase